MAANKTSLSAGAIIREVLLEDAAVAAKTSKVFPVVTDQAILPYILYRRAAMFQSPVKSGPGADTVQIEVICFAESYQESVELAEAVRAALDNLRDVETNDHTLQMRSCTLTDSEEAWQDDAYLQSLVFTVKI
jgi:hypothetical protein